MFIFVCFKIESKMGYKGLKTEKGNSYWNIYKNCELKLNALYLFSVSAIHKLFHFEKSLSICFIFTIKKISILV